ncbi:hypothetical protein HMPREF1155_1349 [Slackia sp. CM382]|nr:hypothetical protein HMPREF1155_1349 [Slackia sp. CM382]
MEPLDRGPALELRSLRGRLSGRPRRLRRFSKATSPFGALW